MADYNGLTRNQWPGTWSPSSDHPIVLDTEIRGGLRYVSGDVGDRLSDITGQRLQDGMVVYVENGYTEGTVTYQSGQYYKFNVLAGESRDASTGVLPNDSDNWEFFKPDVSGLVYDSSSGLLTISTNDGNTFTDSINLNPFSTSNLSEGTNKYYTTARSDSDFDIRLATKSTTNLSEGNNLYYTTTRVDSAFDARFDSSFDERLATKSTTNLSEGSNLYFTTGRADARVNLQTGANLDLSSKSTSDLSEGTNLYFTTARADSDARHALSGSNGITYNSSTGDIRAAQPLDSAANPTFNQLRGPANFVIDPATIGDATGTVQILGNLQVDGTTTTINSTNVSVNDKTFTIADSAPDSSGLAGAGIIWGGALITANRPSFKYNHAQERFDANRTISATSFTGSLSAGNLTGIIDSARIPTLKIADLANTTDITSVGTLTSLTSTGDVIVDSANGFEFDVSRKALQFGDNYKATFGSTFDDGDLQIYHDAGNNNSYIREINTDGGLILQANQNITLQASSSENLAKFIPDGEVELYYNNTKKILTDSDGMLIKGINNRPSSIKLQDPVNPTFGGHVSFYDGTSAEVFADGDVVIGGINSGTRLKNIIMARDDTSVRFPGDVQFDSADGIFFDVSNKSLEFGDNYKATFGSKTGGDLQIYHDAANSYIVEAGAGHLIVQTTQFQLKNSSGSESLITATSNAGVNLFYNDTTRLETTNYGATVTGTVNADSATITGDVSAATFTGSGANLTNLPAGQLTNTIDSARIPSLATSDIVTGTFDSARIPTLKIADLANTTDIDHNTLTNYVLNEHINHANVSIIAGKGLSGGGTIASSRTIDIDSANVRGMFSGGTGITYNSSTGAISTTDADIVHDDLSGFEPNEHIDHTTVSVIAGKGLLGGGAINANLTLNIDSANIQSFMPKLGTDFVDSDEVNILIDARDTHDSAAVQGQIDSSLNNLASLTVTGEIDARGGITDNAGPLVLQAKSGEPVRLRNHSGNNIITASDAGAAKLNYSSTGTKLETTVYGVTVTGTVNADSATITGDVSAGTFTGSGANLTNVDAETLDGINSTSFLRSDAADIKTSGNLTFNDDVRASFGTDNDATIRFNGTNLVLNTEGTGDAGISLQPDTEANVWNGSAYLFKASKTNNNVELYANDTKRLETTAYGATVTGTINADSATLNGRLRMSNNTISGVNNLDFSDPGPNEGLSWAGGNTKIYESPNNLTTNSAGNLQFVFSDTRRMTVDTYGAEIVGRLDVDSASISGPAVIGGNGSTGGITISDGLIDMRSGTGNVSKIKFYCEVSNAHFQTLQAAPHANASSAVLVLPDSSGTLARIEDVVDSAAISSIITADVDAAFINALTIDADTLGTISSTSFLRSDAADAFSGVLTATAPIEFNGGVTYDPSSTGAGSDTATDVAISLGSGTRIVGHKDGYIRTLLEWNSSSALEIGQNNTAFINHTKIYGGTDGGVELYEGANKKLETTTTGVAITGAITSTDSAIFGGNGSSSGVKIDDGAITIFSGTGSPGYIDFYCETSNAHRVRVKSDLHTNYTDNVELILPTSKLTGTILTDSSTATLLNKTFDAEGTGNSISNLDVANFKAAAIVTEGEGIGSNDNDTTIPTSAAVKDYVDNNAGGGSVSEAFKTISVATQSDVVADGATDTLTFVAGSNMTITTNASSDTITFASSGGGGGGGTPGGSNTQVQFNDGGSFGGDAGMTFNKTTGVFAATSKSFDIDHPTKEGMRLRYGSLEGPENGVYVRGRLTGNNTIELPDYWTGLIHEDTITVTLTPIGKPQDLYVEDIGNNQVIIGGEDINCFYVVYGERKDIEKITVEYDK